MIKNLINDFKGVNTHLIRISVYVVTTDQLPKSDKLVGRFCFDRIRFNRAPGERSEPFFRFLELDQGLGLWIAAPWLCIYELYTTFP